MLVILSDAHLPLAVLQGSCQLSILLSDSLSFLLNQFDLVLSGNIFIVVQLLATALT